MAVIPMETVKHPWDASGTILVRWRNMTNGDTGEPFICPHFADKSAQVIGTLGTDGECTIQGSNIVVSPTYATLNDPGGDPLVFTELKIEQLLENTYYTRPSITNGDGTTLLDVYLLVYSSR
jgi:hypothetical protein